MSAFPRFVAPNAAGITAQADGRVILYRNRVRAKRAGATAPAALVRFDRFDSALSIDRRGCGQVFEELLRGGRPARWRR